MNTYRRLIAYVKPFKFRLLIAACCMLFYTFAHSLVSVTVFVVLNGMQNQSYVSIPSFKLPAWLERLHVFPDFHFSGMQFSIGYVPFIVVGVFLLRGIFDYISNYQMAAVGLRVVRKVRDELYDHLVQLSMNFYSQKRTGELMSRTVHDVGVIQSGVTDVIVDLFKQPLVILFNIPFVFFWGGKLAIFAVVVFPLAVVPIIFLGRKLRTTERKTQEQIANINSSMQETFTGMHVVKAFNMEKFEVHKFTAINKRVFEFLKRSVRLTTVQKPLIEVMGAVGIAFAIFYSSKVLPLDRFAAFMACLFLLYDPLKNLSKVNARVQTSVAAGQRIFELMDVPPEIVNCENAVPLEKEIKSAEYRNVSFEYEPGKEVLHDINLNVRGGEKIAIVGTSGAGKTTFVNLLLRFYDVTSGRVVINGKDIRDYDIPSLRDKIGIVTQETFLFNTSVLENISYGRRDASLDEVREAAKAAYADSFIHNLPNGYGTIIGERGVKLSGGQRQRLAIARAVLQNPPILILDEATSHLDTESERQVQAALEKLVTGRTVFVIAHRLSTIQNADRIIVLDKGRLVQSGTNEVLLAQGGVYKRLYDLQFNIENDGGLATD